jgi:hypothetical protein
MAYKRLQAICSAMRQELDGDLRIHETRKLPTFVILPQITAAEYGKVVLQSAMLMHVPSLWLKCMIWHSIAWPLPACFMPDEIVQLQNMILLFS